MSEKTIVVFVQGNKEDESYTLTDAAPADFMGVRCVKASIIIRIQKPNTTI